MAIETFILLDSMDSDAAVFQQAPNGQRSRITKIPWHRPYLQLQVENEKGETYTMRYKSNSDTFIQEEQIKNQNIPANEKFTDFERTETYFRHGVLTTSKLRLQNFLKNHPECEGSAYTSDSVRNKCYKLLDLATENKVKNKDLRSRINAAKKIVDLDLKAAQEMIIRLNGSAVTVPTEIEECQNWLIEFLDSTNEAGIDAVLKDDKDVTSDEKVSIFLGKLLNAKLIEFDLTSGKVTKIGKDSKPVEIKDIFADTVEERQRLFSEFLISNEGKALRADLEKDLNDFEIKPKKQNSKT